MRKLFFSLFVVIGFAIVPKLSNAQCNACVAVSIDTLNVGMVNVDASCSNASSNALYDYYVDGVLYATFPLPYFQIPFVQAGTYNFQVVINDQGCIDSASQTLTINPSCNANFYVYPFGGGAHYFTPTGLISQTANFNWDYGDGNTGLGSTAYHTYAAAGTYTVCLVISDTAGGGCNDTSCQTITVNNVNTACFPNFYYNIDPFTGNLFADASLSSFDPFNYSMTWYLNNVQVQQSSLTSYSTLLTTPGNYDLKLVLGDNANQPCDSLVQTIFWNGPIISNPTCFPCFTFTYNATMDSVLLDASCSILPSGGSLQWNINGSTFTDPGTPFWQGFSSVGTQALTLFSLDSNNNFCDSTFQYAYIYPPACTSCLTVTPVSGSTSDYVFDGSCTNNAVSYSWFVNNSYIITTSNPQFTYSFNQSGNYSVCLQTLDANGSYCNQACSNVVVNTPTTTLFDLSGRIFKVDNQWVYTATSANEAKVYLIKLITGGTLEAVDSTTTDAQGYYTFNNKPIDDYRIKVALNTSSPDYNSNIPTYYASALMWYDAQIVTLFGNTYNRDIYMLYGTNPGGNGFISGNVFQGANKPSRNVVDVTLILVDQSNQLPVAYAKTDANGNYSFSNIPNGTYKVYGELLNRASIPENIVISASQSSYSNKNFVYNDNVIQPTNTSVSVPSVTPTSNLRISPNPATTRVRLENSAASSSIHIRDLTGRLIKSIEVPQGVPMNLDCQAWRKGIYLIEEVTQGVKITHKLNVQ